MDDREDTILFLHPEGADPLPFLNRLLPEMETHEGGEMTWTIDNKYYAAEVAVRTVPLGGAIPSAPVVVYLFSGSPPSPLPAQLTRLSVADPPPDIFLAICEGGRISQSDDERFVELGMDVVNEAGEDDDDERPIDPLESIRQTLQTHMWSGMQRKPTGARVPPGLGASFGGGMGMGAGLLASSGLARQLSGSSSASGSGSGTSPSSFPVTFGAAPSAPIPAEPSAASDFDAGLPSRPDDGGHGSEGEDEDEDENDDHGANGYLPVPDEFGDFAQAEYARLDTWLDDDDVDIVHATPADLNGDSATPAPTATATATATATVAVATITPSGFEDDFGPDSEPSLEAEEANARALARELEAGAGSTARAAQTLDPTPILLHLQAVRAELSLVEDEDERRVRAGEEVARVMRGLGLGDGFDGLEDFDDL